MADEKRENKAEKARDADEKKAENNTSQEQSQQGGDAQMREQMLRMAAEFDNYKKRIKRDIDMAEMVGTISTIKVLLPAIDEFELAMAASVKSVGRDKELIKGFEMVYTNLTNSLKGMGMSAVKSEGKFDPFRQEIVMAMESDKAEGTVLEVVKKGYEYRGILVRPASVIVSRGKANAAEAVQGGEDKTGPEKEEKEEEQENQE